MLAMHVRAMDSEPYKTIGIYHSHVSRGNYSIYYYSLLAGLDYSPITVDIQFQPGGAEEQRNISIPIIDNFLYERNEFFTARLEIPSTETGITFGSIPTTSVTIIDNDGKLNIAMIPC